MYSFRLTSDGLKDSMWYCLNTRCLFSPHWEQWTWPGAGVVRSRWWHHYLTPRCLVATLCTATISRNGANKKVYSLSKQFFPPNVTQFIFEGVGCHSEINCNTWVKINNRHIWGHWCSSKQANRISAVTSQEYNSNLCCQQNSMLGKHTDRSKQPLWDILLPTSLKNNKKL